MAKKKSRWGHDNVPETPMLNYFYNIPNSKLITILIVVTIAMVIILFCLFKYVTKDWDAITPASNASVSTYLSIIGVPIGIILSFIIATTWASFVDAQVKQNEEALTLLLLYDTVNGMTLPEVPGILDQIKAYTDNIINVEFPMMQQGVSSRDGLVLLLAIGESITELNPVTSKDATLYGQALAGYSTLVADRSVRYNYVLNGLAPELWWVLILGVVLIIFLSFFMYCVSLTLQCIITCIAAVGLVALLFLAVALDFPYRGDFGLDSNSYRLVLANMVSNDGTPSEDTLCARKKKRRVRTNTMQIKRKSSSTRVSKYTSRS